MSRRQARLAYGTASNRRGARGALCAFHRSLRSVAPSLSTMVRTSRGQRPTPKQV